MIRSILPLLAALLVALPASAQLPDTLTSSGRIYVLTTLPGDQVHSRYGHTAIRVFDRRQGMDVVFNFGTFDFQQSGFIWRFAHGELDYMLDFGSMRRAAQNANLEERTLRQQLLDINREHRDAIYAALLENARPENATYRYDFLFDNCATRPRDVIAEAMGDALKWDSTTVLGQTFRQLLDPYHADAPELDLGTDLVMGAEIDRVATFAEEAFLPLRFEEMLAAASVDDQYGLRPLVLVADTVIWSPRPAFPEKAFPWPLVLGIVVAVGGLWASFRRKSMRIGAGDRWLLAALGVLGLFLLYMGTMTAHQVTESNFNMLWAVPAHIVAAVVLHRLSNRLAAGYLLLSAALAALSLTGGFLLPQPLPEALVPIVIALTTHWARLGFSLRQAD
ncbi:MAG: DUF4105 domain-containing protein [Rhodothermales bacterium]|nr:DUF4105 domain-containing protein [Rhodothermales bacterium]MBO6780744.1 DUF4105 domain-containing protein [Rhodothermales bacterium]